MSLLQVSRNHYRYRRYKRRGGFSPSDVSGLEFWLDFSDIDTLYQDSSKTTPVAADLDPIGAAEDKSDNGYDVIQATTSEKPTYRTGIKNGLSVGYCNADWLETASMLATISQPNTFFAVANTNATAYDWQRVFNQWDTASGQTIFLYQTKWQYNAGSSIAVVDPATTSYYLFSGIHNGASSSQRVNGSEVSTSNPGTNGIRMIAVAVDQARNASSRLQGNLCEILIYSGALSSSDIADIEDYLNDKWAVY